VHAEAPPTALEVPSGHGVHDSVLAPPLENDATGQLPDGNIKLVPVQYFPGSHGLQLLESVASWYVPAGHGIHVGG
jgi:hypothetical protein